MERHETYAENDEQERSPAAVKHSKKALKRLSSDAKSRAIMMKKTKN